MTIYTRSQMLTIQTAMSIEYGDTMLNYDDAGNRSSVIESGTVNYAANDLNQYNYVGSVYYDYDLNGNTTPFGQENRKMGTVTLRVIF